MLVSAAAYLPLRAVFGSESWATIRPVFRAKQPRPALSGLFPGRASRIGEAAIDRGLLAPDGRLALALAPLDHRNALVLSGLYVDLLGALAPCTGLRIRVCRRSSRQLILGLGFVLCCGAISFAMLAVFRRFANTPTPALTSLSRNAYGIYLLHYGFVMWLQYALLPAAIPAAAKAAVVLSAALAASWTTTAALRRIPGRRQSDLGSSDGRRCDESPEGRTYVVTGAASGIGAATADCAAVVSAAGGLSPAIFMTPTSSPT